MNNFKKILIPVAIIALSLSLSLSASAQSGDPDDNLLPRATADDTSGQTLVGDESSSGQTLTGSDPVSGQTLVGDSQTNTSTLKNPLKVNSVGAAVNEAAKIFSYVAVLFGVIMLIWVGFQFILARGNPDRLSELKSWLLWIVVGLAIVIGARIIIQLVVNTLDATNLVDENVIQGANQAIIGQ